MKTGIATPSSLSMAGPRERKILVFRPARGRLNSFQRAKGIFMEQFLCARIVKVAHEESAFQGELPQPSFYAA